MPGSRVQVYTAGLALRRTRLPLLPVGQPVVIMDDEPPAVGLDHL